MTQISPEILLDKIKKLIIQANTVLRDDVKQALKKSFKDEDSLNGKKVLSMLLENVRIAEDEKKPICQDTGYVDVFFNWPSSVQLTDNLEEIINQAVSEVYKEEGYRNSQVSDPLFARKNTNNNTPANTYLSETTAKKLSLGVFIKGAGSDNSSALFMLNPATTINELEEIILKHVRKNASKACPPLVVGVGVGSSFSKVAYLSKRALFRNINNLNSDSKYAQLEVKLLDKINSFGIGPSGLGGKTTALAVMIESAPCHMAALPLAINLNCYALRTSKMSLDLKC